LRRIRAIEAHIETPEGQLERARSRHDVRPVLRREAGDDGQVVDIGCHSQARIEAARSALEPFREQERPGIDGRRQVVFALRRRPPVQKGQLGQREERVEITSRRDHRSMQVREDGLRALLEVLE
jgi:hypothetical protein